MLGDIHWDFLSLVYVNHIIISNDCLLQFANDISFVCSRKSFIIV